MKTIATAFALLSLTCTAHAHEWYSKRRDPIFSATTCCGGSDCAPLPQHAMQFTADGLRVVLSVDEARAINPSRRSGFDQLIPFDRIQVSEDGRPHICLMTYDQPEDGRQGFYCIFLPPQG